MSTKEIPISMNNRYYGLRHGESAANAVGLVVSDPAIGTEDFGLTPHGKAQVLSAVEACSQIGESTLVYCSDFLRARETAKLATESMSCGYPRLDARLRERYFGKWDMKANTNYEAVWALDKADPHHCNGQVESLASVCDRLRELVESIERDHDDATILLVSHGDPLQLLQTVFEGRPPSEHRALEPWGTAEVRELRAAIDLFET
jgi:broad specificity phosphatase PhoE